MWEMRNVYKVLDRKIEGIRPHGVTRHRWGDTK
jgi:hypothetical protein